MTKSNIKKLFGSKIKSLRKSLNLSQEEFAEKIGLERGSLSKIETGQRFPSSKTIDRISSAFQIDYQELFNFKNITIIPDINKAIIIELHNIDIQTKEIILKVIRLYKQQCKK